eukprot:Pgem_evm1s8585
MENKKVFGKRDNVISHARKHIKYFPHCCKQCKRKFRRLQDLRKHYLTTHSTDDNVYGNSFGETVVEACQRINFTTNTTNTTNTSNVRSSTLYSNVVLYEVENNKSNNIMLFNNNNNNNNTISHRHYDSNRKFKDAFIRKEQQPQPQPQPLLSQQQNLGLTLNHKQEQEQEQEQHNASPPPQN